MFTLLIATELMLKEGVKYEETAFEENLEFHVLVNEDKRAEKIISNVRLG